MGLTQRLADATYRLYPRLTVAAGEEIAARAPTGSLDDLARGRHCAVVSFRRDGTPVSTPVWCAVSDGRVVFRTLASAYKLKRIARGPRVLVAPCTRRGPPTGAPLAGEARVLAGAIEEAAAERAIQTRFGLGRRAYRRAVGEAPAVYVEIRPLA